MDQPIKQGGGHLRIAKHTGSLVNVEVRGNHDTGAFVQLRVWIYRRLRRCFRDFVTSIWSHVESFSAYGSSLLGLTRLA